MPYEMIVDTRNEDLSEYLKNPVWLDKYIASGSNIDAIYTQTGELIGRAKKGVTLLTLAAYNDIAPAVESLLKAGANPNFMTDNGLTPLILSARKGHTEPAKLLLEHGAKVDMTDDWSPLMFACMYSRDKMAKLLIENCADINFTSPDGMTPLSVAAQNNSLSCTKVLCQAGCDIEAKDFLNEQSALTVAILFESRSVIQYLFNEQNAFFPHEINGKSVFEVETGSSSQEEKENFNNFLKSLLENHALNQVIRNDENDNKEMAIF